MTVRLESVQFASSAPDRDAEFWGAALGRTPHDDAHGTLLPGDERQVGLRFARGADHDGRFNRLHLHLSEDARGQAETIALTERLGARLRGNGHVPAGSYAAMADPVGDEFCVIEDGNGYLAGCGPLGEVSCDGSRATGEFWGRVLGWPVVWDEGEERVIQSQAGATKLAWSGDEQDPASIDGRQRFVLTVASRERDAEIDRIVALGAGRRAVDDHDDVTLADPDGNVFVVRTT